MAVNFFAPLNHPIATQRNINIITKPSGQGDMPAVRKKLLKDVARYGKLKFSFKRIPNNRADPIAISE